MSSNSGEKGIAAPRMRDCFPARECDEGTPPEGSRTGNEAGADRLPNRPGPLSRPTVRREWRRLNIRAQPHSVWQRDGRRRLMPEGFLVEGERKIHDSSLVGMCFRPMPSARSPLRTHVPARGLRYLLGTFGALHAAEP